jgi:methylglyoxal synthase
MEPKFRASTFMNTITNELPAECAGNFFKKNVQIMSNKTKYFDGIKRIAILSFQDTRKDLIEWSYANKNILNNHIIISTARTASLLEGTLNSPVLNLHHGRAGGYQQVKELIVEGKIDIVLFFRSGGDTNESWFDTLVQSAIQKDVVVGYNQATIDMLLRSLAIGQINEPEDNEYTQFLKAQVSRETTGNLNAK